MKKSKLLLCLYITIFVLLSVTIPAYTYRNPPERIISLVPAITEELYILGAGAKLVGCTVYCQKPPEAKKKEKVGTALEVNLEKVVSLNPDLILASSLTNAKAKEKLKNLGIEVTSFSTPKSFSQICKDFLELGRIVGKEKEAEQIVHQSKMRVELIKDSIKDFPKQKVFVQVGTKPLHTVTKDSSINDCIEFARGINIACTSKDDLYSREKVLKEDPDVIIIIPMGLLGKEEKENWRRYTTLKAVKNGRISIVGVRQYCSPTPVSFVDGLEEIVKILHPQYEPR